MNWTGFSKKSISERLDQLRTNQLLDQKSLNKLDQNEQLPLNIANQMAENVLGTLSLPFALAPDFLIDGHDYQVPFVTEEPSVTAAASFAAKIIRKSNGFKTTIHNRQMIGQVALYDILDKNKAKQIILDKKQHLLALANDAYPSIVKRGGGARELNVTIKEDFLIIYLTVDTQEAMGANIVNTMMEAIAHPLEKLTGGQKLMAILSNYATESLVTAQCQIDLRFLSRDKTEAKKLAQKMELASQLAQADLYRASTHNKGIFNGIDAVVLATGNDWRAIEAAGHAYANQTGSYKGLSTWQYDKDASVLRGALTLPMPIATKGGSIGLNPTVQIAHEILGYPSAKELASIIVSVGLAQNFAALKALTSTGIQAGHMKLQAKSLALLAGAEEKEIDSVVSQLLKEKHMNLETATLILKSLKEKKN
ncbi:hydroxymethylglutaryl-CoA reductase, degradative [Streptococcus macacae]|uniref:3-hydroxy-3-methylglutaryl coenzyme A reductase n=1 Tax=Streptococcus macacae NCTC 11558 TaxID=764298 RepID=G5JU44_9STRE|nr:hydroxymethylglutaryl-CoA reductase, degradative [Streptococcus macacae]EHJ51880.1 hydroxymethylglutaryl-CoA reductase, degradative [Streptococcus macacae NCTC 11558]SUN78409.1 hydroxymethylglutaryl-CoA reductase [Streptococcus macacae NCTC 11558]